MKDRSAAANSLQLKAELSEPGVAALWVKLPPKALELKPEEVEHIWRKSARPKNCGSSGRR